MSEDVKRYESGAAGVWWQCPPVGFDESEGSWVVADKERKLIEIRFAGVEGGVTVSVAAATKGGGDHWVSLVADGPVFGPGELEMSDEGVMTGMRKSGEADYLLLPAGAAVAVGCLVSLPVSYVEPVRKAIRAAFENAMGKGD